MKKVNPFISKELYDKMVKDPSVCKKYIAENKLMSAKLHAAAMKFLCSKEFLNKVLEGMKRQDEFEGMKEKK